MNRADLLGQLDVLFLDAGGTLITLDFPCIAQQFAVWGLEVSVAALERAEAAAKPVISRALASHSTEGLAAVISVTTTTLQQLCDDGALTLSEEKLAETADLLAQWLVRPEVSRKIWSVVPEGVEECLRQLRDSGLPLVVVSNSDGEVRQRLEDVGLARYFHTIVDSAIVQSEKPDPIIFEHALKAVCGVAHRALHVGDIYHIDVVGARNAGIEAVLLDAHGFNESAFRGEDDRLWTTASLPELCRKIIAAL